MMLDCLVPVGSSTSNVRAIELPVDFARRRAMVLQDKDALITLTTVNDMAQAVLGAIEYQGEWPLIGGIRGTTMTTSKFLEIATKARGTQERASQQERTFANSCGRRETMGHLIPQRSRPACRQDRHFMDVQACPPRPSRRSSYKLLGDGTEGIIVVWPAFRVGCV